MHPLILIAGVMVTLSAQEPVQQKQPTNETGHIKYGYITITAKSSPMFTSCGTVSSGWTTFQRRMDGSVYFRNWADYVNGFGSSDGEVWLGLQEIHQDTAAGCELCIYLHAGRNSETTVESGYAMYKNFSVGSAATNYRLHVEGFSGTVGDSLTEFHNGAEFSARDVDNDGFHRVPCAAKFDGGWWFRMCNFKSHLNAPYRVPSTEYKRVLYWADPWGNWVSLKRTEMSFRCP